ncbi:demethylmenaquinone methyltransferase [Bacteroidia bacterium]|nr:demethylmenaquinone methyltransferase [Bacteroidia bacterium]
MQIKAMFNDIAKSYDLLNHLLSMGIDRLWRRKMVKIATRYNPCAILDLATGTADLAIAMARAGAERIVGVDISEQMIAVGQQKVTRKKMERLIHLQVADGEQLPFEDNSFDMVTVAFGIRNYENRQAGFAEILRVLRPQCRFLMLEFSIPQRAVMGYIYRFYFFKILPLVGKIISRHSSAYAYLPQSVDTFPCPRDVTKELLKVGFESVDIQSVSCGIAHIYNIQKR